MVWITFCSCPEDSYISPRQRTVHSLWQKLAHGAMQAFLLWAVEMHLCGQHLDILLWPAAAPCGNTCPLHPGRQLRVLILYFKASSFLGTHQACLAVCDNCAALLNWRLKMIKLLSSRGGSHWFALCGGRWGEGKEQAPVAGTCHRKNTKNKLFPGLKNYSLFIVCFCPLSRYATQ